MPFETFNPFKQPPKRDAETHKANVAVVRALLGERDAKEYEELTKEDVVDATPPIITAEDLAKVAAMQETERNREKSAEKTKRLWMVWADRFGIDKKEIEEKAEFQKNGEVVWNGDCDWRGKGLTEFPPNFMEVTGHFYCEYNHLTSLKGSPQKVGGNFWCSHNPLLTTIPAGIHIGGSVYISEDQLQLRADAEQKGYKVLIY